SEMLPGHIPPRPAALFTLDPASRAIIADLQDLLDQVEEGWPATGPFGRAFRRIWEWPWQHLEPGLLERPVRAKHMIVAGEEHFAAWYACEQLRDVERVLVRASGPSL